MDEQTLYETLREKQVSRAEIFDGTVLHVVRDEVELPNHKISFREVALHRGAVAVVALTDDGKIIMERQFRYPFDEVLWEIPAGKLDVGESSHAAAAARELREETGITAQSWEYLGQYYASPAILSERIHLYLAKKLTFGERELDEDEFLEVCALPLDEVVGKILQGEIPDGKTQAAVLRVAYMLGRNEN